MASKEGKSPSKKRPLNHFFYKGKLHKKLRILRSVDTIEAWCYPDSRRVVLTYSLVKRTMQQAFSTVQVAEMLGKNPDTIKDAVWNGGVEEPQWQYSLTTRKHKYAWYWREEDIMALHAYMLTVHRGRPRKDGRITPQKLPTARELRAMIRQEKVLYVKNDAGEFVPTWQAEDFD